MFTRPSADDLLEGVQIALNRDIAPELRSEKAMVTLQMMHAIIQCVRQRIPAEQQIMAAEFNQMTETFRELPALIGETGGPAADRIRQRARSLGSKQDLAAIPPFEELVESYREASRGMQDTVDDLDALVREGNPGAERALARVREYLAARTAADFATLVVGAGMAGRG